MQAVSDEQLAAAAAALNAPEAIVKRSAEAQSQGRRDPGGAGAGGMGWWGEHTEDGRRKSEDGRRRDAAARSRRDGRRRTADGSRTDGRQRSRRQQNQERRHAGAVPAVPAVAAAAVADIPDLPPAPETVSPAAAMDYPEVVSVPTAGIKERTGGGVPGWLTSVFVAVPLFALFYLISNAGGVECGEGGALAVRPDLG